jgi:glycosyltransferase involved in cell wall biosynthesis
MDIQLLIPTYKPTNKLLELIQRIQQTPTLDRLQIIIVDDGSGKEYQEIFNQIKKINNCHLEQHAINLGKGRALKTGFNYILQQYLNTQGVVTADADGQHLIDDIHKVINKLHSNPKNLILGVREFTGTVPMRSKIGNLFSIVAFRLISGLKIKDTQTGLRGIPKHFIPQCIITPGEKYEYETNMLLATARNSIAISQTVIQTVYIANNHSSHFNPVLDSLRIYFALLRFAISSITASLIDMLVFSLCIIGSVNLGYSIIIARIISGNINLLINKNFVFHSNTNIAITCIKYWCLVLVLGMLAYTAIDALVSHNILSVFVAKILVESLLFLCSFTIQRDFIFHSKN